MGDSSNMFSRFLRELRRRKTDRVIVFYAATAFVILQLTDMLSSPLSLPEWTMTFVIVLLAIGFPIAAVLSWVFDLTPEGIEKTKPFHEKKKHGKHAKLRLWKSSTVISVIIIILLLSFNIFRGTLKATSINNLEKSIAVLPFRDLSNGEKIPISPEGIATCVYGSLGKISEFRLIPTLETNKYTGKRISISRIGRRVNASLILYGTMQKVIDSVRINVQLIIAGSNYVLLTKNYTVDSDMTTLGKLETELPFQIAARLNTELTSNQKEMISKRLTKAPAAFIKALEGRDISDATISYLLQGNEKFEDISDSANFKKAILSFDEAIRIDSGFAYAYAQRAITRSWAYYRGVQDSISIKKCREDIDKAMKLEPDSKDAQIAEGFYYYYCKPDYQKALYHFNRATLIDPEDWQGLFYMSLVHRRLGQWEKAKEKMSKVLKYRPQNALILTNIGLTYDYLRDYDSALIYHNLAIKFAPGWKYGYNNKMGTLLRKNGNVGEVKPITRLAIRKTGDDYHEWKILLDLYEKKFDDALYKMQQSTISDFEDEGAMFLLYAKIYDGLSDFQISQSYYNKAAGYFEKELKNDPENPGIYSSLGIAYAGLKQGKEAKGAGEKAVEITRNDAIDKPETEESLAQIYTLLNEFDNAFETINYLLNNYTCFSIKFLELDPKWNSLRDKPEYRKLLMEFSKN
jgi:tetratricopeptide (TPR) repeat protein